MTSMLDTQALAKIGLGKVSPKLSMAIYCSQAFAPPTNQ